MKEKLLKRNVILYMILHNASLLYTGYVIYPPFDRIDWLAFIYPGFFLLMLAIAISQKDNPVIGTVRSYSATATVTLIFSGLIFGGRLIGYANGSSTYVDPKITVFIYPGVLFIGSVLIAINYFRCAVITWKEDRDLWEAPDGGRKPTFFSAMMKGLSMKKVVSVIVALVIALSAFFWYKDKHEPTVVELTTENVWEYVAIDYIQSFVAEDKNDDLRCSISGVLSHAVYEDVVLTFQVDRVPNDGEKRIKYDVQIMLNAAGEAEFKIDTAGLATILNGKGECYTDSPAELLFHRRSIFLEAVEGKVIYGP